jgi:hypothetical protein
MIKGAGSGKVFNMSQLHQKDVWGAENCFKVELKADQNDLFGRQVEILVCSRGQMSYSQHSFAVKIQMKGRSKQEEK